MKTYKVEGMDEYIDFLIDRRGLKGKSAKDYGSYLRSVSNDLKMTVDRSTVSCEEDVAFIKSRLLKIGIGTKTVSNRGSALKKYFEFANEVAGLEEYTSADEIAETETFIEGAKRRVTVNAYERDPKARRLCIKRYGLHCAVCEMNFADTYGEIGTDYIHVHHKKKLSTLGNDYKVDPENDLIPVCPNCHAMLHKSPEVLSIEELRALYRSKKRT